MHQHRHFSAIAAIFIFAATLPSRSEIYQHWAANHFTPAEIAAGSAAPNHDHDGDACPNILEYAGACLPADADSSFETLFRSDESLGEITVSFPFALDRTDIEYIVLVSSDLKTWTPGAIFVCGGPFMTYHLNGHRYAKIGIRPKPGMMMDSDADGLSDLFEESLVHTDPDDSFQHIGQILPHDDFDGDGTLNIDEEDNRAGSATFTKPSLLDPALVSCVMDQTPPPDPTSVEIHTPLK